MLLPRYYFADEFTDFDAEIEDCAGERVSFEAGEYLCPPGQALYNCYYITEGIARFSVLTDNAKDRTVAFWGVGSIFPIIATVQDFTLEPFLMLSAVTRVTALALTPDDIGHLCAIDSAFSVAVIDHYGRYTNLMLVRDVLLSDNTSMEKVCNFLYLFWENNPSRSMDLPLSQDDIASITGLTRVQVTHVCADLREEGTISTARRKITILDVGKLKQHCLALTDPSKLTE